MREKDLPLEASLETTISIHRD